MEQLNANYKKIDELIKINQFLTKEGLTKESLKFELTPILLKYNLNKDKAFMDALHDLIDNIGRKPKRFRIW
jgi:hypothetical protein